MYYSLIFLLVSLLSMPTYSDGKIIGGQVTRNAPFYAALVSEDTMSGEPEVICGGTLINKNWILTAAHCISDTNEKISVSVGKYNNDEIKTNLYEVKAVFQHPGYEPENLRHDIALLYLGENFNDPDARSANLPYDDTLETFHFSVYGFGNESSFGLIQGNHLRTVDLLYMPRYLCEQAHDLYRYLGVDHSKLCTISVNGFGQDSCQGDSGGPVISYTQRGPTLIGLVSYGVGCAQPGLGGINTFIPFYLEWIGQTIQMIEDKNDHFHLADSFCYNRNKVVSAEFEEFTETSFTIFEEHIELSKLKGLNLTDIQSEFKPIGECSYEIKGNHYTRKSSLFQSSSESYIKTSIYHSNEEIESIYSQVSKSFNTICLNENTQNLLVSLSQDRKDQYTSSINLAPVVLQKIAEPDFDISKLPVFAECHLGENKFSIYQDTSVSERSLVASVSGEQFNAKEGPVFFKAEYLESSQEPVKVQFVTNKEKSDGFHDGLLRIVNDSEELVIYTWQLQCEGIEMKFFDQAPSSTSPVFSSDSSIGVIGTQKSVEVPLSFRVIETESKSCLLNGLYVDLDIK